MTPRTFHWEDCADVLDEYRSFERDSGRASFSSKDLRVATPLVLLVLADCRSIDDYLNDLPDEPGDHTVILMQAGAVSLGRFEAAEEVATKTMKRYVVRGRGRAQQSFLDTKGKSRYGSRLRLQNAKRLLEETNEKLNEWEEEFGAPDLIFYNSPVRIWPDLFKVKPDPPFAKDDERLVRIPRDLPKPTTDVLLRAYKSLCYGRIDELGMAD